MLWRTIQCCPDAVSCSSHNSRVAPSHRSFISQVHVWSYSTAFSFYLLHCVHPLNGSSTLNCVLPLQRQRRWADQNRHCRPLVFLQMQTNQHSYSGISTSKRDNFPATLKTFASPRLVLLITCQHLFPVPVHRRHLQTFDYRCHRVEKNLLNRCHSR